MAYNICEGARYYGAYSKRKNAVAFADAINSIEGVPPSPIARRLSDQWQQEKISSTEMVRALVEHYSALGRK